MDLVTPDIGLIFWTSLIFIIVWFILGKYAFRPIADALKAREGRIQDALSEAEKARAEMAALKADNEVLLNQAKEERARIIKEAKEIKDSIIAEAREKANVEFAKRVADADREIFNKKMAAITDVKNQIGTYAITLSKEILGRELNNKREQERFVNKEIKKIRLS